MLNLKKVNFVGLQGHRVSQSEVDLVKQRETTLVYMKKDIRNKQIRVEDLVKEESDIAQAICMDLSVVRGHYVPGVSEPCPSMGFTDLEIEEIANQVGKKADQG